MLLQNIETKFYTTFSVCERWVKYRADTLEIVEKDKHPEDASKLAAGILVMKDVVGEIVQFTAIEAVLSSFNRILKCQKALESDQ